MRAFFACVFAFLAMVYAQDAANQLKDTTLVKVQCGVAA